MNGEKAGPVSARNFGGFCCGEYEKDQSTIDGAEEIMKPTYQKKTR